jgi:hypothetical protein
VSWNPAPDEIADRYVSARSRVIALVAPPFRALTGRRSGGRVARFEWTDDAVPCRDLLSRFGPLRISDVSDVAG